MSQTPLPILYSFRRCPYAMRARLALRYAGITVELREVDLKNKPAELLTASPKGTVPVLQFPDGKIIEESLDIMYWAVAQKDIDGWALKDENLRKQARSWIVENDTDFVKYARVCKYPERYPDEDSEKHRDNALAFIHKIEVNLGQHQFLLSDSPALVDAALLPFVRQFMQIDVDFFRQQKLVQTQRWLDYWLQLPLFAAIMQKHQPWQPGAEIIVM